MPVSGNNVLTRGATLIFVSLILSQSLMAESIEGTVVVRKRLTNAGLRHLCPLYQRGPAVGLDADADADPIALERSRVAIYVEGRFRKPLRASRRRRWSSSIGDFLRRHW